ncbi:MAG TPA: PhoU domain-containing protein [Edaphobacter sp.]|nr:PhoU domain-containing protein [Edaphobacter sp.]
MNLQGSTTMDVHKHICVLRIHLLTMCNLSQRALDYSIKGYEMGHPGICAHACSAEYELAEHHFQIKYLCRKLMTASVATPSDLRFVLATLRIDHALHAIFRAATRIAQDSIHFLEGMPAVKCPALNRLGEFVNCSMRLCIVALFKKDFVHAETVLQSQGVWRRCEMVFDDVRDGASHRMEAQDVYALAIARSLGIAAKQVHEMADAILFWLKGSDDALALMTDGQDTLNLLFGGCSSGMEDNSGPAIGHHTTSLTPIAGLLP